MTTDREPDGLDEQIETVAVLRDPVRRALYKHVSASGEPVGRDAAASAVGVSRALAAFHLDKLVEEGLLAPTYRRLSGRTGPGAGRPAKLYQRSGRQVDLTLPPRDYELAARLLLQALTAGSDAPQQRLSQVARQAGHELGAADRTEHGPPRTGRAAMQRLVPLLAGCGYEPVEEGAALRLRNCPFHALAEQSTETVCGMNLSLLEGVLDGLDAPSVQACLEPDRDRCCVALRPVTF